ncbi:MipA/OmpV family protein [uncultured Paracoccus sp.]|uniref:MipA/OmpV family protein n=1 Tax=uncultured Paracoccus sp. TaxID=189685 RepID=UPI0025DF35CB|nr:MipA/OmpV family protein [uncultured Paracoccus sp.]
MRHLVALLMMSTPLAAQGLDGYVLSADIGIGAEYGPAYPGASDSEASPWFILRNGQLTRPGAAGPTTDGFSVLPSFGYVSGRDQDDHESLAGTDDIDAAGEVGLRLSYDLGQTKSYVALRKGFGGHSGVTGEFGAKYRFDPSDRLTLWTGAEARFADSDFTRTYFGISDTEAPNTAYSAYTPGGGIYAASLGVEARYAVSPSIALLGGVEYTRLLGDASDSPLVQSRGEPSVKLGVVRRFDFRF